MTRRLNGALAAPFFVFALSLIAILRWQSEHPLPIRWDEANYVNYAIEDHRFFQQGGVVRVIKALLFEDPHRPPAYRALALPVTMFVTPTLPLLRGIALFWSGLAALMLFVTWRRVVDVAAAAMLAAMSFATPAVMISAGWFGTEYPLFLATALLMAALIPRPSFVTLMLAVALGLLSKSTFLVIAFAPLLVAAVIAWRERRRDLLPLAFGSLAGALIASGWWLWHLRPALEYAQYGRTFPRVAALTDSVTAKLWILTMTGIGPGVLIALVVLIFRGVRASGLHPGGNAPRWIAAAASLPLLLLGLTSPVFVPRHFSPALLPLPFIGASGLARRVRVIAIVAVLAQALFLAVFLHPLLPRVDQTDWGVLRPHVGTANPTIAFLGGWSSLSPPEVRYAWLSRGGDADVQLLWDAERPAIDWKATLERAFASDAVFVVSPEARTADEFTRRDNAHNAELIARLRQSGRFHEPVLLPIGDRDRAQVLLFKNKKAGAP